MKKCTIYVDLKFTRKNDLYRSKIKILVSKLVGRLQIYGENSKLIGHVISLIFCKVSSFMQQQEVEACSIYLSV